MTQHTHQETGNRTGPVTPNQQPQQPPITRTAWVNWIWFAGAMMILLGLFNVIQGLVALFNDEYYVVGPSGLLVFDITGWGWVQLGLGAAAVAAGVCLFTGAMWARVAAVLLAAVNAVAQMAFLAANPVWCTIVIALDVLVIWAIVVHGKEVKVEQW
ncbi:hypothetical protein ABZ639_07055 [Saccharomonospora sp. NPDC006951]